MARKTRKYQKKSTKKAIKKIKKNRPKFPNGYNKANRKISQPSSVQQFNDLVKKTGMILIERYEKNVKALAEIPKGTEKYEQLESIIKYNATAIQKYALEMQSIKPKKKYWRKSLLLYEKLWDFKLHTTEYGTTRLTRESNFRLQFLRELGATGKVDIHNPVELAKFFRKEGINVDELYENWKDNNTRGNKTFYEEFKEEGVIDFIQKYKTKQMLKEAKRDLLKGWEDIE